MPVRSRGATAIRLMFTRYGMSQILPAAGAVNPPTQSAMRRCWRPPTTQSMPPILRSEEHTSELQSPTNLVCRLIRSEEHTSELQSPTNLVCRLLLEKKKKKIEEEVGEAEHKQRESTKWAGGGR